MGPRDWLGGLKGRREGRGWGGPALPASCEGSLVRGTQAHLRISDIGGSAGHGHVTSCQGDRDFLSLVTGKSVPPKFFFQRPFASEPTALPPFPQDSLPGLTRALWFPGPRGQLLTALLSFLPPDHSALSRLGFLGLDPLSLLRSQPVSTWAPAIPCSVGEPLPQRNLA